MHDIQSLTADQASAILPHLSALLLQDAVASGASVGFLSPLSDEEATGYWQTVIAALREPYRVLLMAKIDDNIAGTVQLDMEKRANGSHRAGIAKLLVHTAYRRRGIGRSLMMAIEAEARKSERTTLVLDTRESDPAVRLYTGIGYTRVGTIPEYARSVDGSLHSTVFMYRLLNSAADAT